MQKNFNKAEYKISDIRLMNILTKGIDGDKTVKIKTKKKDFNIKVDLSENMLRELLIVLDDTYGTIENIQIGNSDKNKSLEINNKEKEIEYNTNKVNNKLDELISSYKNVNLDKFNVNVLSYKKLILDDVLEILKKHGKIIDAGTITLNNNEKVHILKYKSISVALLDNKMYTMNFGIEDRNRENIFLKNIKNDIDNTVNQKSRVKNFSLK